MSFHRLIRFLLANLDQVDEVIAHAVQVWEALQDGDDAAVARESGEFLIWLSTLLEAMDDYSGADEVTAEDYQELEKQGISIGSIMLIWQIIQLLLPLIPKR